MTRVFQHPNVQAVRRLTALSDHGREINANLPNCPPVRAFETERPVAASRIRLR
jgi:hypothetical protein